MATQTLHTSPSSGTAPAPQTAQPAERLAKPPPGRVARRREAVRARILEVAERLIEDRGVEALTIDEIAAEADIARRSFYHHFDSKHDVLVPIARARTDSLNVRIDRSIDRIEDPAAAMATAMRLALRAIDTDPLCRWFFQRSGLGHERLCEGLAESGARDAQRAVEAGRFQVSNFAVTRVLVSGCFLAVLNARWDGQIEDTDLDDAIEQILRLFGLAPADAKTVAHLPLPKLKATAASSTKRKSKRKTPS